MEVSSSTQFADIQSAKQAIWDFFIISKTRHKSLFNEHGFIVDQVEDKNYSTTFTVARQPLSRQNSSGSVTEVTGDGATEEDGFLVL